MMASAEAAAELAYPWASLGVTIAAAVMAGLILAPLDLIRTKFVFRNNLVYNTLTSTS